MQAAISSSAASVASGQYGFPAGASGQKTSQWISPDPRYAFARPLVCVVPQQVGCRSHPATLLGDQRRTLADPRIDDELPGLALQLAEHGTDRDPHSRHHGRGVGVHQIGQLLAVTAVKGAHLNRFHQQASSNIGTESEMTTGPLPVRYEQERNTRARFLHCPVFPTGANGVPVRSVQRRRHHGFIRPVSGCTG